jgi:SAM-dependent methyltransferase
MSQAGTTQSPGFDIIVPTLGRVAELDRLLASLAAQTYRAFRLIVVDQNPDDRLAPVLERYASEMSIVRLTSELGASRGRNAGLAAREGELVAFADDDCWYPPDLLAQVERELSAHPEWDGVTGRVVDAEGRPSVARWSKDAGRVTRANVWTSGVAVSIYLRGYVVDRVGPFDESLGVGAGTPWGSGEETDYLLRALEHGFELHYDPALVSCHEQTRADTSAATVAAGFPYGMGMGRVLRKHGYPPWSPAYHAARAVGGAALALGRGRPQEARFQLGVARGRARGWLAPQPATERSERERQAYDEGVVAERSAAWHRRVPHVLDSPNTLRGEELWRTLIREAVGSGGRVLDVGCGSGATAMLALESGASYALGVEISASQLDTRRAEPGRLEFRVADAQQPIDGGPFDLVVGRSVLHHLDFREFLDRVASSNLAPGGRMLWMEPLAHPLSLAFHKLVRSAHTPDEFPLLPRDLRWIRRRFPNTQVFPVNLVSFPAGVVSSGLFSTADNPLLKGADALDRAMFRWEPLASLARQGIILIHPD